ncbi:MAG: haloacid dehalogenase type II [Hyphomicrobiaceae bacterium]|nr:haloacid dehalogenase type II [Hyphomicrobiaceae bacterium]
MSAAPIYAFDAYGTLFDVHSAAARLSGRIGPAWERLSELWRTKQLEYTWIHGAVDRPATFWSLTERALDFAIAASGATVDDATRASLLDAYRELAAYPEVARVLRVLKERGARLSILSNGDPDLLERAIDSAGLVGLFEHVLSVAQVRTFKPSPLVYRLAVEAFDVVPGSIKFCSSNRWDIAGANAFGFETLWINRLGRPDEYPEMPPSRVLTSLDGLLE